MCDTFGFSVVGHGQSFWEKKQGKNKARKLVRTTIPTEEFHSIVNKSETDTGELTLNTMSFLFNLALLLIGHDFLSLSLCLTP